jgi:hypothetical protein
MTSERGNNWNNWSGTLKEQQDQWRKNCQVSVNTLQLLESSSKKSSLSNIFFWQILIIKPTRWINFLIYLWNKILHVTDSSSVHHQECFTVHTAIVYVIQVCWQLASRISAELQFRPDPARKLPSNLYNIYNWGMYSEKLLMMGRGTVRNM